VHFTPATSPRPRDHSHLQSYRSFPDVFEGCLARPSPAGTISSSTPSKSSSAIPLRTLVPSSRQSDEHSLLEADEKQHGSRRSSDSTGSAFSYLSDTGDLGDQLADEEDPLRIDLDGESEGQNGNARKKRRSKRVHYVEENKANGHSTKGGIDKEQIPIPDPPPRTIRVAEVFLAFIMTGSRQSSLRNGLVGKPLLYVDRFGG
jgi:hypothetical protein